jgi:gamma-glutamylcyclotransferase (GGCT)/AIG2-like uncharacterized protein YtfP
MSLHKIFVYGTLKRGFHNNSILGPSEFLGVRLTQRRFTMYDGRQFPYVIPEGNHTIVGELYEVDDKILERLYCCVCKGHISYSSYQGEVWVSGTRMES